MRGSERGKRERGRVTKDRSVIFSVCVVQTGCCEREGTKRKKEGTWATACIGVRYLAKWYWHRKRLLHVTQGSTRHTVRERCERAVRERRERERERKRKNESASGRVGAMLTQGTIFICHLAPHAAQGERSRGETVGVRGRRKQGASTATTASERVRKSR